MTRSDCGRRWGRVIGLVGILGAGCAAEQPVDEPADTGEPAACSDLAVDEATLFVDAAAPEGGDGSEAAPFATVAEGLALARERGGGLIALAAGTYVGAITLDEADAGVTIAGRCAGTVTLTQDDPEELGTVMVLGSQGDPTVALSQLTVTGASAGVWVEDATVTLDAVAVEEAVGLGVIVFGRRSDVTLRDTTLGPTAVGADGHGIGLYAGEQAQVEAERVDVVGSTVVGVLARDEGTRVSLTDSRVAETLPDRRGDYGYGLDVFAGAVVTLTTSQVVENTGEGVLVRDAGTEVSLVDSVIEANDSEGEGAAGFGLDVAGGATVTIDGGAIRGNRGVGLVAGDEGTTVTVQDSEISGTVPSGTGWWGYGVDVIRGAHVVLTRAAVAGNAGAGVAVSGADSLVELVDTDVVDTAPADGWADGLGVSADGGGAAWVTGGAIRGNVGAGIVALGAGSVVRLADTEVADTSPREDGWMGMGAYVGEGAALDAERTTWERNTGMGVYAVGEGTMAALVDNVVRGTLRGRILGFGTGVFAQGGAVVTAEATRVVEVEGAGLYATDRGAIGCTGCELADNHFAGALTVDGVLDLDGCSVTDTAADPEFGGGMGVYAHAVGGRPSVRLADSTVGPHPYAAVWLDGAGDYDLDGDDLSGSAGVAVGGLTIHGNAVYATGAGTDAGLTIRSTLVSDAAVGVLLDASTATFTDNAWDALGVAVWQQRCDTTVPLATDPSGGAASVVVCPTGALLTDTSVTFETLYTPDVALGG